jgi:hypothetical protein
MFKDNVFRMIRKEKPHWFIKQALGLGITQQSIP